jgi:hypothetical protein
LASTKKGLGYVERLKHIYEKDYGVVLNRYG